MFHLNVKLLVELSNPETVRKELLRDLFSVILESAISTFDFDLYSTFDVVQRFFEQALAHSKDSASNLLQQILNKAPGARRDSVRIVLRRLMEALLLVNTASLEIQTWLELFLKAYITKSASKRPSTLEGETRWKLRVEEAKQELRKLPELKQALGDDRYNRLIGSTAQVVDKAHPPAQSKRKKDEDTNDAGPEWTSKRARRGGEQNEEGRENSG